MNAKWITALAAIFILVFLSSAHSGGNTVRGADIYKRCSGCHSLDHHRVGPRHRDVVGRRAGTAEGFGYSMALKNSTIRWTEENLDRWLEDPKGFMPGSRMGYALNTAQDRADVIAYLSENSKSPGSE